MKTNLSSQQLEYSLFLKAIPPALAGGFGLIVITNHCAKLEGNTLLYIGIGAFILSFIGFCLFFYLTKQFERSVIDKISYFLACLSTFILGWSAIHSIINRFVFTITYSQPEIIEVIEYYKQQRNLYSDFNLPNSKEELHILLSDIFSITFTVNYINKPQLEAQGYVKSLDFGSHNIYVNNSENDFYNNCYIIAHEIRHLKGDINEATTSFNACKRLFSIENNFCKHVATFYILVSLTDSYCDKIYNFTQFICEDYYINVKPKITSEGGSI